MHQSDTLQPFDQIIIGIINMNSCFDSELFYNSGLLFSSEQPLKHGKTEKVMVFRNRIYI